MKYAYCATIQPKFGGLRSFNIGLAHALKNQIEEGENQLFLITREDFKSDYISFGNNLITYSGNQLIFENTRLPLLLKKLGVDFAIFPHNRIPIWQSGHYKSVCIFHDLLFWRYPERLSFLKRSMRSILIRFAANHCHHSFSVSKFTAEELASFIPGHKSIVCYQAIDTKPQTNGNLTTDFQKKLGILKPYFLFIGAHSFQKNLPALIEAFNQVKNLGFDIQLILGGGSGSAESEIRESIKRSKFSNDILTPGFLEENQKIALMKHTEAFVFPSIYEGFGIPLLEAFQLGVPVICSNASCLPEISNGAALEVDPNPVSIAQGMINFLENPEDRSSFITRGLTRIKDFTWSNTASTILNHLYTIS